MAMDDRASTLAPMTLDDMAAQPSQWPYMPSSYGPVPALPVKLWSRGGGDTVGYLDSGSPRTGIPVEYKDKLGVRLEEAEGKVAYAGGQEVAYLEPVEPVHVDVAGRLIRIHPVFGNFEHLILGRDVFEHFRVTFDERAQTVILDPYPEAS
jgi:hypothetical protein